MLEQTPTLTPVVNGRFELPPAEAPSRNGTAALLSTPELSLETKIRRLQGPILVLGGSGFVGANLLRALVRCRPDCYGTTTRLPAWRLEDLPAEHVKQVDLLIESNLDALLEAIQPRTVFNCVA